jgi:undecaprenyl pyrophosphate synthase
MAQVPTTEVVSFIYSTADLAEMEILILSREDSRLPIIDLARTLGDMTKQEKLFAEEISTDLIHEHLTGKGHPSHPSTNAFRIIDDGTGSPHSFLPAHRSSGLSPLANSSDRDFVYPRCFYALIASHLPDNVYFGYSVFIRALQAYNKAEMRLGR